MSAETPPDAAISLQSRIGLYAAYFFLTEMVGVVMPFLDVFLRKSGWRYDTIGIAAAVSGLGTLVLQIPAGILSDEIRQRRFLLGAACVFFGISYALLPVSAQHAWAVYGLLFLSGGMYAFFVPVAAALALSLAGPKRFDWTMGASQGWSHAGNLAAAITALITVQWLGVTSVFYTLAGVCFFAMLSLMLIRKNELHPLQRRNDVLPAGGERLRQIMALFKDRRVTILVISVAFFQIANAPAMPLAALYLQHMEGSEAHTAWIVLLAQTVMIPVSLVGAQCCTRFGRKPVFAVGFIMLPIRLVLFALAQTPLQVIGIQSLDGLCAGIYDVVICIVCADLTRGRAGFNTLVGVMYTTVAFGGFLGPLVQGWVTEHIGFPATFAVLAGISLAGTVLFLLKMPETLQSVHTADAQDQAAASFAAG